MSKTHCKLISVSNTSKNYLLFFLVFAFLLLLFLLFFLLLLLLLLLWVLLIFIFVICLAGKVEYVLLPYASNAQAEKHLGALMPSLTYLFFSFFFFFFSFGSLKKNSICHMITSFNPSFLLLSFPLSKGS